MTPSLHDRSLLFGLVALHHRLVARPALEGALAAWTTDNARPLSQILLEQQALTAKEVEAVEVLVGDRVSRHGDVAAALDALGTETGTAESVAGTPDTRAPSTAVSVAGIPDTRAPSAVVPTRKPCRSACWREKACRCGCATGWTHGRSHYPEYRTGLPTWSRLSRILRPPTGRG